jgi:hypothetical protein
MFGKFARASLLAMAVVGSTLVVLPSASAVQRCEQLLPNDLGLGVCDPCFGVFEEPQKTELCGEQCPTPITDLCNLVPDPCPLLSGVPAPGIISVTCRDLPKYCKDPVTGLICEEVEHLACEEPPLGAAFLCELLPVCDPVPRYVCRIARQLLSPVYQCYPPTPGLLCPDK